jgi:hypothetical protein
MLIEAALTTVDNNLDTGGRNEPLKELLILLQL